MALCRYRLRSMTARVAGFGSLTMPQEVEAQIRALDPGFVLDRVAKPRGNLQKKAKVVRLTYRKPPCFY